MTKVLFKGAKNTKTELGYLIRSLRYNYNLTQEELAGLLKTDASTISRIETGKTSIDKLIFDNICIHFNLPEEQIIFLRSSIVTKKKKSFDYIKNNLGQYVKKLREQRNISAYDLSLQMGKDKRYISKIESDTNGFCRNGVEQFISILNLDSVEAENVRLLDEYFEYQPKIRESTPWERFIVHSLQTGKSKDRVSRRSYLHDLREKFNSEVSQ